MATYTLTSRQKEVYDFIKNYIQTNNKSPYIREIQEGCHVLSYKGVVDRLLALEKKGYISRTLNKHRGIKVNSSGDLGSDPAHR